MRTNKTGALTSSGFPKAPAIERKGLTSPFYLQICVGKNAGEGMIWQVAIPLLAIKLKQLEPPPQEVEREK